MYIGVHSILVYSVHWCTMYIGVQCTLLCISVLQLVPDRQGLMEISHRGVIISELKYVPESKSMAQIEGNLLYFYFQSRPLVLR